MATDLLHIGAELGFLLAGCLKYTTISLQPLAAVFMPSIHCEPFPISSDYCMTKIRCDVCSLYDEHSYLMSSAGAALGCVINLCCKNRNGSDIGLWWHLGAKKKSKKAEEKAFEDTAQETSTNLAYRFCDGIWNYQIYSHMLALLMLPLL